MICGNKQDIEKILPYVSEGLQKALQYIKETNFAEVKNGEYEIDGRDVFVRINTYATEDKINKKPEAHNQYIDVQYLGAGQSLFSNQLPYFCSLFFLRHRFHTQRRSRYQSSSGRIVNYLNIDLLVTSKH